MKNSFFYCLTALILLSLSCANPRAPMGGPRDTSPPKIIESYPKNNSTSITPKILYLKFDEFIVLDNPKEKLIISPPIDAPPNISINNKTLLIDFQKNEFKKNSTYSINFNGSIKDFNEGNSADSLLYIFSTGNEIDAQKLSGKIIDAQTGLNEPGFIVGLYLTSDSSLNLNRKPDYYTISNSLGEYSFSNLKHGTYFILAFKDENKNLKKDLVSEKVGFFNGATTDSSLTSTYLIKTFIEQINPKITNVFSKEAGKISFAFNQKINSFELQGINLFSLGDIIYNFNSNKDSLELFYNPVLQADALKQFLGIINDTIIDTLKIKIVSIDTSTQDLKETIGNLSPIKQQKKKLTPQKDLSETDTIYLKSFSSDIEKKIGFSRPIKKINQNKIHSEEENITIEAKIDSENPTRLVFHVKQNKINTTQDSSIFIGFEEGALVDYLEIKSIPFTIKITLENIEERGELKILISSANKNIQYLLNLYDSNNQMQRSSVFNETTDIEWKIKNLLPGNYTLKIIEDLDKNKAWTTGDIKLKQLPETIHRIDKIEVRSKWENEIKIKLP